MEGPWLVFPDHPRAHGGSSLSTPTIWGGQMRTSVGRMAVRVISFRLGCWRFGEATPQTAGRVTPASSGPSLAGRRGGGCSLGGAVWESIGTSPSSLRSARSAQASPDPSRFPMAPRTARNQSGSIRSLGGPNDLTVGETPYRSSEQPWERGSHMPWASQIGGRLPEPGPTAIIKP